MKINGYEVADAPLSGVAATDSPVTFGRLEDLLPEVAWQPTCPHQNGIWMSRDRLRCSCGASFVMIEKASDVGGVGEFSATTDPI